jgi:serine/threonine-protein kinase
MAAADPKIIGRYALHDEIASGGMATVHIGRLLGQVGFSRTVAIKRLHPQFAKDPEFVSMFLNEARLAARIQHPNVVQTLDVETNGDELLLVLEFVLGESLARLIRISNQAATPLPLPVLVGILVGALDGLQAVHEAKDEQGNLLGLVHRDVSPQNILVGADGVARVLDFGIAKATRRADQTRSGLLKGKVAYMAPEQLKGGGVDRRTDIYAASVVLWESLTGYRLFDGEDDFQIAHKILLETIPPPSHYRPDIPPALDAVVLQGLARDTRDRFPTALAMVTALESVCPLASSREISRWIDRIAGTSLRNRSELVTTVERITEQAPLSRDSIFKSPSAPVPKPSLFQARPPVSPAAPAVPRPSVLQTSGAPAQPSVPRPSVLQTTATPAPPGPPRPSVLQTRPTPGPQHAPSPPRPSILQHPPSPPAPAPATPQPPRRKATLLGHERPSFLRPPAEPPSPEVPDTKPEPPARPAAVLPPVPAPPSLRQSLPSIPEEPADPAAPAGKPLQAEPTPPEQAAPPHETTEPAPAPTTEQAILPPPAPHGEAANATPPQEKEDEPPTEIADQPTLIAAPSLVALTSMPTQSGQPATRAPEPSDGENTVTSTPIPEALWLAQQQAAGASTEVAPVPVPPAQEPGVASQISGISLLQPLPAPRGKPLPVRWIGLGAGALLVAGLAFWLRPQPPDPPPPAASTAPSSDPPPSAPAPPEPPPASASAETSAAPPTSASQAPEPPPPPTSTRPPEKSPKRNPCSPPYTIDKKGIKRIKPECI